MNKIHPTAFIEEGAELGDNIEVGAYCSVGKGVKLGNNCVLKSHVVIEGPTTIGENNIFFPFSLIGAAPQDLKYKGEETTLTIGDNNQFRESVSVHRGTVTGGGKTTIGNNNLFMGYVHVAHDCHLGNHNILANYTGLSGHVMIQDYVTLGGQNGVTQFVRIGSYAYTGAGSLIDKHLVPYTTGYGNRFEIKGINIVGLKRHGYSRDTINCILESHRIFFRQDLKTDDALRQIDEAYGDVPEVNAFTSFIREAGGTVKK